MSVFLVDSYSEENTRQNYPIAGSYYTYKALSQSFTGQAGNIVNAKFYIYKSSSSAGNITAKLYAHSGTYGVSSVPTGAVLAASDTVDITTLSTRYELTTFTFTGAEQYTLVEGTKYCIVVEYSVGDQNNFLNVGVDGVTLGHSGNRASQKNSDSTWVASSGYDVIFYVYAEGTEPPDEPNQIQSIATPKSLFTTKEINGAWTADLEIIHEDLNCEQYIDIDGEQYIVKIPTDYKDRNGTFIHIQGWHIGMAELGDATIDRFNLLDSPSDFLTLLLADTTWTAGTCDIDENVYVNTDKRTTVLEALTLLATRCSGELYFNSTGRTVDLKREIGTHTGLQIRYSKNSDYIAREMDSTNLVTRIYPYGADNLAINQTTISYCEDETLWTASGTGTATASTSKMFGSQAVTLTSTTLNETFILDLGAGAVKDLTDHTSVKFWIYSDTANANGFTFGIGESAYTELTVNTGALSAKCWTEVTLDLSATANAAKDAIRYIGFKNLTGSAVEVIVDGIRGFYGTQYIDSPNRTTYKVNKEYVYRHSAKPEKQTFEVKIFPSDDAIIRQGAANTNYGSTNNLQTHDDAASNDYQYLIKWALTSLPTGATIDSASMVLNVFALRGVGNTVQFSLADADWNEETVTWNNAPSTTGAAVATQNMQAIQEYTIDITSTVDDWWDGTTSNYGLIAEATNTGNYKSYLYSKESSTDRPYLLVKYTVTTDPNDIIVTAATQYLYDHDEPSIRYTVNMSDLSRVIKNTWEDETINIGDTVKVYDKDLGLNVNVRVYRITKNLLDPADVKVELVNRAYNMADLEAKRAQQLSYAMPCNDNPNIIDAAAIQIGYLGENVQL